MAKLRKETPEQVIRVLRAGERLLTGVSMCRNPLDSKRAGDKAIAVSRATSKSEVSGRLIAMTGLFANQLREIAIGIGIHGFKHPFAVMGGSEQATTLLLVLLVRPRNRCLDLAKATPADLHSTV